ncbi:hydrophobin, partial [Cyathus striatus]
QCNTGSLQCCNSTQAASDPVTNELLGLLGIVLGPITGLIGFNCSPLTVAGVGGNSCTVQPVCCTSNQFNGLLAVGCNPINLNCKD